MSVCPGCGRCSECGRGHWPCVPQPWTYPNTVPITTPYPYQPIWQQPYTITC